MEFRRDSFDRFGDDLSELILGYLPLSDCFRLRGVSRQFNALIFNRQTKLILSDAKSNYDKNYMIKELFESIGDKHFPDINYRALNYVLNRCVNINDITIDGNRIQLTDELINIISNACRNLIAATISVRFNNILGETWQHFAENSFSNLEALSLHYIDNHNLDLITTVLPFTPRLNSIRFNNANDLFADCFLQNRHQLLRNIVCVKHYIIRDESFTDFADYFAHRLKSLNVIIDPKVNITILSHLADFEKLEYLYCNFCEREDQYCNEVLRQIGVRCIHLKVLAIDQLCAPFYEVFNEGFIVLEKLIMKRILFKRRYMQARHDCENLALLVNCVQLKHLKFELTDVDENSFNNIHLYLPQLNSIEISKPNIITSNFTINLLQYLSHLPNLRDLKICYNNDHYYTISTDNVISFINNCLTIRNIHIHPKSSNIVQNNIVEHIASSNRKINFIYY